MADVNIQCLSCGNQITVSDVVDIGKLKCRACGGDFLRSGDDPVESKQDPQEKKRSLMGKKHTPAVDSASARPKPTAKDASEQEANRLAWDKLNNPEAQAAVRKQSSKMYSALTWKAWVVFIIIAIIAGGLRYSGLVSQQTLDQAVIYEAITVFVFFIVIILQAFQDSVFQGILCLLIPPYALYYLFSASDQFFLRAIIGGLLVGIGQDAGLFAHEWSLVAIDAVNKWIASGG